MRNLTTSTDRGVKKPALDYCDPKITSAVDEAYDAVWLSFKTPIRLLVRRRHANGLTALIRANGESLHRALAGRFCRLTISMMFRNAAADAVRAISSQDDLRARAKR
jgi:hypothetical protein